MSLHKPSAVACRVIRCVVIVCGSFSLGTWGVYRGFGVFLCQFVTLSSVSYSHFHSLTLSPQLSALNLSLTLTLSLSHSVTLTLSLPLRPFCFHYTSPLRQRILQQAERAHNRRSPPKAKSPPAPRFQLSPPSSSSPPKKAYGAAGTKPEMHMEATTTQRTLRTVFNEYAGDDARNVHRIHNQLASPEMKSTRSSLKQVWSQYAEAAPDTSALPKSTVASLRKSLGSFVASPSSRPDDSSDDVDTTDLRVSSDSGVHSSDDDDDDDDDDDSTGLPSKELRLMKQRAAQRSEGKFSSPSAKRTPVVAKHRGAKPGALSLGTKVKLRKVLGSYVSSPASGSGAPGEDERVLGVCVCVCVCMCVSVSVCVCV